jgi:ABC-type amino acid transport substrate-binding protein
LEVFDPSGAYEVTALHAKRLDTLAGKTICELSNGSWEDNRTFPVIRELLQKQYPTIKIVTYDNFPVGKDEMSSQPAIDAVRAAGCQGVVLGNAG